LGALRQGGAYPNVKQAQIFHGISSKNNKFRSFMANYDLLLFVGERDKQRFDRIGVTAKTRWKLIGLPRSDRIARGEIDRTAILHELGLNPTKPSVLYAPTHGSLSSFYPWGPEVCRAVGAGRNLIVKPHPLIARAVQSADAGDASWTAVQAYVAERDDAVFLPGQADIQRLMVAADVLVTDFSSAAEEFLMFNRPLVFANHLAASGYHQARGEWDEIHSCGAVVTETRDLEGAIARALEHPEEYEPQRTRMRDYVFYRVDGHAAERAAQALVELSNGTLDS
jgi:CDP-glycerol glycerophosphotransferase